MVQGGGGEGTQVEDGEGMRGLVGLSKAQATLRAFSAAAPASNCSRWSHCTRWHRILLGRGYVQKRPGKKQ